MDKEGINSIFNYVSSNDVINCIKRIMGFVYEYQKYGFIFPTVMRNIMQFYEDNITDHDVMIIDEYFGHKELTEGKYKTTKTKILEMMYILKNQIGKSLASLDYYDFYDYYHMIFKIHNDVSDPYNYIRTIRLFLEYCEHNKVIAIKPSVIFDSYGHPYFEFILRFMKANTIPSFSSDEALDFHDYILPDKIKELALLYKSNGYQRRLYGYEHIYTSITRFLVFCDMNNLPFTKDVAYYWAYTIIREFIYSYSGTLYGFLSRYIDLIKTGSVSFSSRKLIRKKEFESLPAWAKEYAESFIRYRKRLGYSENTINMDRRCIIRLVEHAVSYGISSFDQMDDLFLKYFSENDHHQTGEGKNAYLCRTRIFFRYLSDTFSFKPLSASVFLRNTRTAKAPPKVLDESFVNAMESYQEKHHESEDLRDYAMYLIALRTGFRITDIVNLKFSSVSLKDMTITVMQKKTKREIITHLPVEVANAIYRYVKMGRPKSNSEYIFLSMVAPHDPLTRSVAVRILSNISKNIGMETPNGFHVIRKTFATDRIKSGAGLNNTAAALGHSDTENVKKYVSLDEKNMKKCPLSLDGIEMEEIFK